MSDENTFSNKLKSLRTGKGTQRGTQWTQTQVAEKLEVSRATYNYWENGVRLPSDYHFEKIVELLKPSQEDVEELYRLKARVPPVLHTLPFLRNRFFTGRETKLEQLGHLLQEHGSVAINQPVSISGLGGIGKTQLALEYAHRSYPDVYRAVFWMKAEGEPRLQAQYDDLAQLLGLPEHSEHDSAQRVQAVKQWMENHTEWLLVLDNADDLYLARGFLPAKPRGHIIVTTRSQMVSALGTKAMHIELDAMEPAEGLFFLLKRAMLVNREDEISSLATGTRDAARELVRLFGGHPLALDQAGAYVEETGTTFADYIQLYQQERHYLLHRRGLSESQYSDYQASVAATIALSFRKAREKQPVAADLLYFCSFLIPDAMPEELLYRADGFKFTTLSFDEAIAILQRYSLIKRNAHEKLLSMHHLVQDVLISTMSLDLRKQWFLCVQRTLSKAEEEDLWGKRTSLQDRQHFRKNNVGLELPKPGRSLSWHARLALRWADGRNEDSILFPSSTIIKLFLKGEPVFSPEERKHSELKHREAELQGQLSLREKKYGTDHLELLMDLLNLGDLCVERGKYDQAEALYERAARIYEHHLKYEDNSADVTALLETSMAQDDQFGALREHAASPLGHLREKGNSLAAFDLFTRHMLMSHAFYKWAQLSQIRKKHEQAISLYEQALNVLAKSWDRPNLYAVVIKRNYIAFLRSIGRDGLAAAVASSLEPNLDSFLAPTSFEDLLLMMYAFDEDETLLQELDDLG